LDIDSVEFVLGNHVKGNLTDDTEDTMWNMSSGCALLPVFPAYFRNCKSYQSSHK